MEIKPFVRSVEDEPIFLFMNFLRDVILQFALKTNYRRLASISDNISNHFSIAIIV